MSKSIGHALIPVVAIDCCLPQTQCTRCGYPSCHDYAQAVATREAPINRCPPGGETTIQSLARLLDQPLLPLDPKCGRYQPPMQAFIIEASCIGCTLCLQACPVDAIVGSAKQMHTVITDECTGCELCIEPCPVDCIQMDDAPFPSKDPSPLWPAYSSRRMLQARRRFNARSERLRETEPSDNPQQIDRKRMQEEILESVERVRRHEASGNVTSS